MLLVAFLIQGTWALAGTTGSIRGSVNDGTGAPVAGAKITASSPSQTISTTTDARGNFGFLSLAPDSYTVSVEKDGYNPISVAGVTVFADNSQTLALTANKTLTTIAKVTSTSAGNLVKAGTTSDIYSVNAATQQTLQGIGGGLNINSAYSAIYSQPGVSSYIGNYGQGQVFYIRGASYGETGYEFDGVPVNRAFDNYGGSSLSNLGQQELQVYTGGSPSSGTSATLGGYINQVIKTGTYPGYGKINLGLGTPGFYHDTQFEAGGASPNRLFSWYVGFDGYNQSYRAGNNSDVGNISSDGTNSFGYTGIEGSLFSAFNTNHYGNGPFGICPNQDAVQFQSMPGFNPPAEGNPICNAYGVSAAGYQVGTSDREIVGNFHFGIPHKNDGGKDDIQLMYDHASINSTYNDSINDLGGVGAFQRYFNFLGPALYGAAATGNLSDTACWVIQNVAAPNGYANGKCAVGGGSPFPYQDGYIFATGTQFGANALNATVQPYLFPNSPTNRVQFAGIPTNQRAGIWNDVAIVKAQYQKNIGSNAYARIYGYSFYSDWLMNSPEEATMYYGLVGYGYGGTNSSYGGGSGDYPSPDYELETHTRGVSFEYANQINAQNLLRFTANYTTATLNRFNNKTWLANGTGTASTSLIDGAGNCYSYTTGKAGSCLSSSTRGTYGAPTRGWTVNNPCSQPVAAPNNLPGSAACVANASFVVTRPSGSGTTNGIIPKFVDFSLEDEFRPNDKLDLNIGVRMERYQYDLVNSNTPQFNFWFNAASQIYCYDPVTLQPILKPITPQAPPPQSPYQSATPGGACINGPSGQPGVHPDGVGGHLLFTAVGANSLAHTLFSPRIGGTYTLNPNTVLRFSAGRYTQPTPAAFEQYLNQDGLSAAQTDFKSFFGFGYNTPAHDNPVQTSNNYDFSIEKRLNGTDITMKLSPFYRYTTHQSVSIPLGPNFVSAVNLGTQKSQGVEFQISKGDPTRDGWAGQVSYTYTDAKIRYENAPNGRNATDLLNDYIGAFNGLTQAGGGSAFYCSNTVNGTAFGNPGAASAAGCAGYTPALGAGGAPLTIRAIANPYYTTGLQSKLDRNGFFPTYPNSPPADAPSGGGTAISPNFFSGFLQYKHAKLAIAPNFVLAQGNAYGSPTDLYGVDPRTCTGNQGQLGILPAGSPYGNASDYYSCGASLATQSGYLAIPDPNLGNFAKEGQYRNPWQLNIGAQVRYEMSNKVTATLDLANLYNRCFGGSSTPWSNAFKPGSFVCGYGANAYAWTGAQPGAGFYYGASASDPVNGTAAQPKSQFYQYTPLPGAIPFQAYFQVQIKL